MCVVSLLMIHGGLLAWSATRHSPTLNEPGHLVAGLTHWKFGRFEVYCVNPPLVHYVSAIPVMLAGYNEDWSGFYDSPGARPEFKMGEDFIKANGKRSIWLFTMARWACIPFSLIGGLFCFFWSRELWGSNPAGLISLFLWCFEPNILAHGELITPDCAASAFGLGAGYLFWRWLKSPTWGRALAAGAVMGLALLAKTSWIIFFGLWPLLWLFWIWTERHRNKKASIELASGSAAAPRSEDVSGDAIGDEPVKAKLSISHIIQRTFLQLAVLLLTSLYVLNLGYGFDESFTKLKEFTFISTALTGLEKAGTPGNRFEDSWLGEIPVPVPKQFLRGIDLQEKDFENYGQPSYLRGEWKDGGWWYYYLYGLAVKMPHGSQFMLILAGITLLYQWRLRRRERQSWSRKNLPAAGLLSSTITADPRDLIVLLTPAIVLLVLVSSQLEFNHHVRYVLPVLGFSYAFTGVTATWFTASNLPADKWRHSSSVPADTNRPH